MSLQPISLPDADLLFAQDWLDHARAAELQLALVSELTWRQHQIKLFGKTHLVPRLTAWHGDPGTAYRYSGTTHVAKGWTPALEQILALFSKELGQTFNSVLANYYRNGADSMGWHSDDEPELGQKPTIASLSFGQKRRFRLKHRQSAQTYSVELGHGSLLVMAGGTQRHWQHAVPKTSQAVGERINLTFRTILN